MSDYKFEGWVGHDKSAGEGNMKWGEFTPKTWDVRFVKVGLS